MSEPRQKSDIVMDIFKIAINKIPQENITKEQIVETYNYIYNNICIPSDCVQIIDNIPNTDD